MTNAQIFQLIVSALTVLGASLGAFYSVRISVARVEEKVAAQAEQIEDLKSRVNRLETPHFQRGR